MRNVRNIVWGPLLCAALAVLVLFAGCRAFEPETVIVNKAPETYILGSPLEHGGGYFHYRVFWYGSDEDGQVVKFVWALTDTTVQDLDTAEDEEDARFNPALDESQLAIGHWTTKTDSIFDFTINQGTVPSVDMTLHMVAVDDFGDFDRTPARLHFFSNTLGTPGLRFFRVLENNSSYEIGYGVADTVGVGQQYHLRWEGSSPNIRGYDPLALALVDTVEPFTDGLLGFKWQITGALGGNCVPNLEDCWHPRAFNEATGDSFSYFGDVDHLVFYNDYNSPSTNPFLRLLNSGAVGIQVNSLDVAGVEVIDFEREFEFIVNYDPDTRLLDFESDFAHPEDTEVYPYYILLNDTNATPQHYPFHSGDRIPDRTYVVFKALAKDDDRDLKTTNYTVGLTGIVNGVRSNFTGGTFSFSSGASDIDSEPQWPAGVDGWYADTLGFLTGPRTEFTFKMQAVDEHGRRDGTPATLSFDVGFPPCVQCIELLPSIQSPSAFGPDLACYDGQNANGCLDGGVTEYYILGSGAAAIPGRTYLTSSSATYLAINKNTFHSSFQNEVPDAEVYYSFLCKVYKMAVLLHGLDNPDEAWPNPLFRSMGWKYQIDYDCDPFNGIKDGGGQDDILAPTWGNTTGSTAIEVNPVDGLWKLKVNVMVPDAMVTSGILPFRQLVYYTVAGQDEVLTQKLVDICTRQLSDGRIRAVALDQTQCGFLPTRPAKYHLFQQVRPSGNLTSGTWRDCQPTFTGTVTQMDLSKSAMASHLVGDEVERLFKLVLQQNPSQTPTDFGCNPPELR